MSEWEITDPAEIAPELPIESIDAHLVKGSLSVAVTDGPARILVSGVRGAPLVIRQVGGALTVTHPPLSSHSGVFESMLDGFIGLFAGRSTSRSAEVAILVPSPVRVAARTASADILLSGVVDSEAETVSGAITASAVHRSLRLSSISGDIAAADIHGRLWLKTVSGDMTVAGTSLSELSAHTVSGDAVIDADLEAGTHTFRGISGGLALRIRPDAGLDLDATSVSGTMSCALGDAEEMVRPGSRRLKIDTGDGRARLRCHTVSGDVTVVVRAATLDAA